MIFCHGLWTKLFTNMGMNRTRLPCRRERTLTPVWVLVMHSVTSCNSRYMIMSMCKEQKSCSGRLMGFTWVLPSSLLTGGLCSTEQYQETTAIWLQPMLMWLQYVRKSANPKNRSGFTAACDNFSLDRNSCIFTIWVCWQQYTSHPLRKWVLKIAEQMISA